MMLVSFKDLTETNLTNVFREHFDSTTLSVTVKEDANDHFVSDIRKLALKIKREDREEEEKLSVVVKTTPQTAFLRFILRLSRPFLTEVMWYSVALPSLAVHYPEVATISPVCYYGSSSLLKNRQAEDYWEGKFGQGKWGLFFKMMYRKDEARLLLL